MHERYVAPRTSVLAADMHEKCVAPHTSTGTVGGDAHLVRVLLLLMKLSKTAWL